MPSFWTSRDTSWADSARLAKLYDALVASRAYNAIAWGTDPADYAAFAAEALGSASGPVLEVAAGSTAQTLPLYVACGRRVVITDRSPAMLDVSRRRAHRQWRAEQLVGIEWREADMWHLPESGPYDTVLAFGLLHLVDDIPSLVEALRKQCAQDGTLWLTGLVGVHRRSRAYLGLLHSAGEGAVPRTLDDLVAALPKGAIVRTRGAMAYVTLLARG